MSGASSLAGLIDIVIGVTLLEAVLLLAWRRVRGTGLMARQWLPSLVAGLFLMLALRLAVAGAMLPWTALCLMASGVLHAADLRQRWSASRPQVRDADLADDAACAILAPVHPAAEQLDALADTAETQPV